MRKGWKVPTSLQRCQSLHNSSYLSVGTPLPANLSFKIWHQQPYWSISSTCGMNWVKPSQIIDYKKTKKKVIREYRTHYLEIEDKISKRSSTYIHYWPQLWMATWIRIAMVLFVVFISYLEIRWKSFILSGLIWKYLDWSLMSDPYLAYVTICTF